MISTGKKSFYPSTSCTRFEFRARTIIIVTIWPPFLLFSGAHGRPATRRQLLTIWYIYMFLHFWRITVVRFCSVITYNEKMSPPRLPKHSSSPTRSFFVHWRISLHVQGVIENDSSDFKRSYIFVSFFYRFSTTTHAKRNNAVCFGGYP